MQQNLNTQPRILGSASSPTSWPLHCAARTGAGNERRSSAGNRQEPAGALPIIRQNICISRTEQLYALFYPNLIFCMFLSQTPQTFLSPCCVSPEIFPFLCFTPHSGCLLRKEIDQGTKSCKYSSHSLIQHNYHAKSNIWASTH